MSKTSEILKALNERVVSMYNASTKEDIARYAKTERVLAAIVYPLLSLFLFVIAGFLLSVSSDPDVGVLCMVSGGAFCVVGLGLVLGTFFEVRKSNEFLAKRRIKKILRSQAKSFFEENELSNAGFYVSKRIELRTSDWQTCIVFFDDKSKRFVIKKGNFYGSFYGYEDVLGYEVIENGKSQVQGRAGSALIGGAFFGLGGAIVGGSRSRTIDEMCSRLSLIVRIKNLDSPQIEFVFFNNANIDKSSLAYKSKIDNMQLLCSHLEYVMNSKNEVSTSKEQHTTKSTLTITKKEQLQELKEMLDDGLITQEDYEQKKKQILNL